jgi:hypothetical protein
MSPASPRIEERRVDPPGRHVVDSRAVGLTVESGLNQSGVKGQLLQCGRAANGNRGLLDHLSIGESRPARRNKMLA